MLKNLNKYKITGNINEFSILMEEAHEAASVRNKITCIFNIICASNVLEREVKRRQYFLDFMLYLGTYHARITYGRN